MRKLSKREERDQWTQLVTGTPPEKSPKYHNQRTGKYASGHEAEVAAKLWALERSGRIWNLVEQDRIVLVPGDSEMSGVVYVADFTYYDDQGYHVLDAKGVKTQVYKVKKRLAWLLHKIRIEEV